MLTRLLQIYKTKLTHHLFFSGVKRKLSATSLYSRFVMFTTFYCHASRDSEYVYVTCMNVCCGFYIYHTGINKFILPHMLGIPNALA